MQVSCPDISYSCVYPAPQKGEFIAIRRRWDDWGHPEWALIRNNAVLFEANFPILIDGEDITLRPIFPQDLPRNMTRLYRVFPVLIPVA